MRSFEYEDDDEYWQFWMFENGERVGGGIWEYGVDGSGLEMLKALGNAFVQGAAS